MTNPHVTLSAATSEGWWGVVSVNFALRFWESFDSPAEEEETEETQEATA